MRRADRLFATIQALRGGRLRTARELALELEISERTVYRDIVDLQTNGVPIDGERGVGYILRDDYFLPPLRLTRLEREALDWGVAFVAAHADDALSKAARELQIKLHAIEKARVPTGQTLSVFQPAEMRRADGYISTCRQSLSRRQKLQITYCKEDGLTSVRIVRPLGLEHWGRVWTLTCWCECRADFRCFRIDRIQHIVPLDIPFDTEPGKTLADFRARLGQGPSGKPA